MKHQATAQTINKETYLCHDYYFHVPTKTKMKTFQKNEGDDEGKEEDPYLRFTPHIIRSIGNSFVLLVPVIK